MNSEFKSPPEPNLPYAKYLIFPVWVLAAYALGLLMTETAPVFLWIVCAFFLFALLDPMAEKLKAHGWPTLWSSIFLIVTATALTALITYLFGYLFSEVLVELEKSKQIFIHTFESLNTSWNTWFAKLPGFHGAGQTLNPDVSKVEVVQSSPIGGELSGTILHGLGNAFTILTFSLLVPILAFFFLAERDTLAKSISKVYKDTQAATLTWAKIVQSTRAFFVGNLFLAAITYPVFIIVFWLFSVSSVFTVAALATFFNLIPFAGAVLSGFLPAVALYAQTQSLGAALGLYGCCMGLHFIVADFITPKILGAQVNINATTSTIALVAWGELWGGIGLILAIPLTSLLKILFEHSNYPWLQWVAELMSEQTDSALRGPSLKNHIIKNKDS